MGQKYGCNVFLTIELTKQPSGILNSATTLPATPALLATLLAC